MPDFVDPNQILDQIALQSHMVAVDFGCGSGGWAIPLAKRLTHGKVFAIDLQEECLSALSNKASLGGVSNIQKITADIEEGIPGLRDSICDLVLMTNLLFEIDNKRAVFKEAERILKQGGRILVIDWKPNSPLGPKEGKISAEEVKELARETGFELERSLQAGDYHYGLVFVKPGV